MKATRKNMKTIINGRKYDTAVSKKVFKLLISDSENFFIYQNKNLAFFKVERNVLPDSGEVIERILPMRKIQVQDLLISEGEIDIFEKIFGAVPEAEGEDFISAELAFDIESVAAMNYEDYCQPPPEIPPAPPPTPMTQITKSYSLISSLKLIWYAGINDLSGARLAINSGADCSYKSSKCLVKAVVNKNTALVKLLVENGANPADRDGKVAKLAFYSGDVSLISAVCSGETTKDILLLGIEKTSALRDMESLNYLIDLLKKTEEGKI